MARAAADSEDSDFGPQRAKLAKKEPKGKKKPAAAADAKKKLAADARKREREREREEPPRDAVKKKKKKAAPPVVEADDSLDPAMLEEKYRALKNVRRSRSTHQRCLPVCLSVFLSAHLTFLTVAGARDGRGEAAAPGARAGAGRAEDPRGAGRAAAEGDHGAVGQAGGRGAGQEEGQGVRAQQRRGRRPGGAGSVRSLSAMLSERLGACSPSLALGRSQIRHAPAEAQGRAERERDAARADTGAGDALCAVQAEHRAGRHGDRQLGRQLCGDRCVQDTVGVQLHR